MELDSSAASARSQLLPFFQVDSQDLDSASLVGPGVAEIEERNPPTHQPNATANIAAESEYRLNLMRVV